jgi:hypothetical protein
MRVLAFALAALGSTDLAAQSATGTVPADQVDLRRRFMLELPAGWRALQPDEGRALRERQVAMPSELLTPAPPQVLIFGPVEAWQRGEFDGRALVVVETEGEPEVDDAGVTNVRAHWVAQGEARVRLGAVTAGTMGPDKHPALLSEREQLAGDWRGSRFEAYVPTAGVTLVFSLGWPTDDRTAGAAAWTKLAASAKFARQPRGPTQLGSKLFWAAVAGLVIGAVLHTLRKRASA